MTTTAVFAEVLVVGIQAAIWVLAGVAAFADIGGVATHLRGWEALVTVVALALAYVLGVAVDRLADSVLGPLRNRAFRRKPEEFAALRRHVLERSSPLSTFVEYQRSRMRLMRGTVFNLAVALPVANLLIWRRVPSADAGLYLGVSASIVVAIAVCWYAYMRIGEAQDRWLQRLDMEPPDLGSNHAS